MGDIYFLKKVSHRNGRQKLIIIFDYFFNFIKQDCKSHFAKLKEKIKVDGNKEEFADRICTNLLAKQQMTTTQINGSEHANHLRQHPRPSHQPGGRRQQGQAAELALNRPARRGR